MQDLTYQHGKISWDGGRLENRYQEDVIRIPKIYSSHQPKNPPYLPDQYRSPVPGPSPAPDLPISIFIRDPASLPRIHGTDHLHAAALLEISLVVRIIPTLESVGIRQQKPVISSIRKHLVIGLGLCSPGWKGTLLYLLMRFPREVDGNSQRPSRRRLHKNNC